MDKHMVPEESYSRKLDDIVAAQEMPYGYSKSPPPSDHQNKEALAAQRDQSYGKRK